MDGQTRSMVKDAVVVNSNDCTFWSISCHYEMEWYFLSIDNDFNENNTILKFTGQSDAITYLKILQDQL